MHKFKKHVVLEKPSLEVAPTTLRLVLLIYSLHFRSAFPPFPQSRVYSGFASFSLTFSRKKEHFPPVTLELLPMTLTYELELDGSR